MHTITPEEVYQKMKNGEEVHLIDVRTHDEFNEISVGASINIPLSEIKNLTGEELSVRCNASKDNNKLFFICHSGYRAELIARRLISKTPIDAFNVDGGLKKWEESGLPVVRKKK